MGGFRRDGRSPCDGASKEATYANQVKRRGQQLEPRAQETLLIDISQRRESQIVGEVCHHSRPREERRGLIDYAQISRIGCRNVDAHGPALTHRFTTVDQEPLRMPSNPTTRLTACLERLLYSDMAWIIGALALAVAEAFTSRHAMNPDGLSYVEMAQTALRTGARGLINGYWSPGYPALIAATFRVTRPTIPSEFPVVHGLNVVIFAVTLLVWRALLKSWETQPRSPVTGKSQQARSLLVPVGFGIFLLIALDAVGPAVVTPDLAVLAVTLLIALCYQRLRTSGSWAAAGALGLSAALAFWMKAVMFPLGAMFLALLLAFPPPVTRARAKVLAAGVLWLAGAIPLIGLISAKLGRVSYGETGHLNYAFYVVKSSDATHKENDGSSLVHPPRVLLAKPRILEFGTPIPGTFPLHYDPSYWSEGIRTRFDLRDQAHAVAVNAREYAIEWFSDIPGDLVDGGRTYRSLPSASAPGTRNRRRLCFGCLECIVAGALRRSPRRAPADRPGISASCHLGRARRLAGNASPSGAGGNGGSRQLRLVPSRESWQTNRQ